MRITNILLKIDVNIFTEVVFRVSCKDWLEDKKQNPAD